MSGSKTFKKYYIPLFCEVVTVDLDKWSAGGADGLWDAEVCLLSVVKPGFGGWLPG